MTVLTNNLLDTNTIEVGKWYYSGDVNPEYGGIIYQRLENDCIDAYYIGEYSPISFCSYITELTVIEDYTDHDSLLDAYYNGELIQESYTDQKFMKAIDWEYTNETNRDLIDQFVRYDYNIWNLIKRYIGVPKTVKIHTPNGAK